MSYLDDYSYAIGAKASAHATAFHTPAPKSLEETQREKLESTLKTAFLEHKEKLSEHYGISDQEPPHNAKELVKRIKDGEFTYFEDLTLHNDEWIREWCPGMTYGFRWRNPKTKYDRDGFDVAEKALNKAYEKTKQDVWFLLLADALTSVRAFEEKKFH
jgi:hypothetical protein